MNSILPDSSAAPNSARQGCSTPKTPTRRRLCRLADTMRAHGGGVAIVFTAPEVMRNRDSDYPYRWDSYFYYLTQFSEPESALVLRVSGGSTESILFCRRKDAERETWDGFRYGPDAARERFGFDKAFTIDQLDQQMPQLLADQPSVWYALGSDAGVDARMQRWLDDVRAMARTGVAAPSQAFDVRVPLDEMRLFKDESEQKVMRRAAVISAAAHVRAMQATRPGRYEYEIEAEILHEFRREGSQFPAYGSIVAGGRNACVLHYRGNDQPLPAGQLLLIDAGCELDGYAADITRTFPISGRFSPAQREIYEIVLASQAAAIEATRPGRTFNEPHDAAVRVLTQGMIDCGLLSGSLDGALESGSYRRFYMHRTGHWLGMDVHDCGDYREPIGATNGSDDPAHGTAPAVGHDAAAAAAATAAAAPRGGSTTGRPWRTLRPGMVVTVEPGMYINAADDVPERFHDIGIRIEDDALLTADGCDILTRDVPKTVADIEALMRDASSRS